MANYKILSVYSHKGGVGKTTMVDILGGSLFDAPNLNGVKLKFKRCLMIDLDAQMNLTCKILGSETNFDEYINSLYDINDIGHNSINPDIKTKLTRLINFQTRNQVNPNPLVINEELPKTRHSRVLHLIPGYPEMAQIIKQMSCELDQLSAPLNNCRMLKNLIDVYVKEFDYDLVILDLGPNLYTLNCCALWSSDYVLVPCTADIYSAMSFRQLASTIFPSIHNAAGHGYHRFESRLKILGFVPNRVKIFNNAPTRTQAESINKLQEKFVEYLLPYFSGNQADHSSTHPCYIQLLGGDSVNNATQSLVLLHIAECEARSRLRQQLSALVLWLNSVIL